MKLDTTSMTRPVRRPVMLSKSPIRTSINAEKVTFQKVDNENPQKNMLESLINDLDVRIDTNLKGVLKTKDKDRVLGNDSTLGKNVPLVYKGKTGQNESPFSSRRQINSNGVSSKRQINPKLTKEEIKNVSVNNTLNVANKNGAIPIEISMSSYKQSDSSKNNSNALLKDNPSLKQEISQNKINLPGIIEEKFRNQNHGKLDGHKKDLLSSSLIDKEKNAPNKKVNTTTYNKYEAKETNNGKTKTKPNELGLVNSNVLYKSTDDNFDLDEVSSKADMKNGLLEDSSLQNNVAKKNAPLMTESQIRRFKKENFSFSGKKHLNQMDIEVENNKRRSEQNRNVPSLSESQINRHQKGQFDFVSKQSLTESDVQTQNKLVNFGNKTIPNLSESQIGRHKKEEFNFKIKQSRDDTNNNGFSNSILGTLNKKANSISKDVPPITESQILRYKKEQFNLVKNQQKDPIGKNERKNEFNDDDTLNDEYLAQKRVSTNGASHNATNTLKNLLNEKNLDTQVQQDDGRKITFSYKPGQNQTDKERHSLSKNKSFSNKPTLDDEEDKYSNESNDQNKYKKNLTLKPTVSENSSKRNTKELGDNQFTKQNKLPDQIEINIPERTDSYPHRTSLKNKKQFTDDNVNETREAGSEKTVKRPLMSSSLDNVPQNSGPETQMSFTDSHYYRQEFLIKNQAEAEEDIQRLRKIIENLKNTNHQLVQQNNNLSTDLFVFKNKEKELEDKVSFQDRKLRHLNINGDEGNEGNKFERMRFMFDKKLKGVETQMQKASSNEGGSIIQKLVKLNIKHSGNNKMEIDYLENLKSRNDMIGQRDGVIVIEASQTIPNKF